MSQSHASPTASRRADAAGPEPVSQTDIAGRSARSTLARIGRLSIGTLLVLVALVLLGAGGTGVWADRGQRDAGYVTTSAHNFTTTGAALATGATLGSPGVDWLDTPSLLGKLRIRVTPRDTRSDVFVGIG